MQLISKLLFKLGLLFYSVCFTLLLPVLFLRLWVKGKQFAPYRKRWAERLAFLPFDSLSESLWVHAVSVGESLVAVSLIKAWLSEHPNRKVFFTTTTPTSSMQIQTLLKDNLNESVYHSYFPFDLPYCWPKLIKHVNPKVLVLLETELWPNLLNTCHQYQIPILMANAKLSTKSLSRYKKINFFMQYLLNPIQHIAAQSPLDVERYYELGVSENHLTMSGNIKFDYALSTDIPAKGLEHRQQLGNERLILIAGSTHEEEEEQLLQIYQTLKVNFPALLLILVPRHPNRFDKVADLIQSKGLTFQRRSHNKMIPNLDVFLVDTMGELVPFYAASDIAFMGGTLVKIGGHNLLEPAALGLPIVSGPHLFTTLAVRDLLLKEHAIKIAETTVSLTPLIAHLLQDANLRRQMGEAAKRVVAENKGALNKVMRELNRLWETPCPQT